MAYNLKEVSLLRKTKWHKNKGLFYAKGGKGIENSPISLRGKSGYGCDCSTGSHIIRRERSKGEINALMA